ncbi:MAG TPA: WD40 repeat domain-containing protein [Thermoanaerobaculia bacterium]|nr:WD40 repeat domain-containing protein [Thermoanaerobaculia bacterium]
MKIALVFVMLLLAAVALWHFERTRASASEQELARVLQLDARKVAPSTRALLLLEAIPRLRDSERGVAVERLRRTLETVPRGLVLHHPSFAVEAIRFSADGRAVLWYGKTPDGITVERWSQRMPRVVPWSAMAANATFVDDAGSEIITDSITELRKGRRTTNEPAVLMTGDGAYLSRVRDDVLWIWRVRDFARSGWPDPAFWGEVPYPVRRVHCVAAADLCGLDTPGSLTIVDVKKGRVLRSIPVERTAPVHLSPSGRLAGVAGARGGLTIHTVRDGRKVRVDTPDLEDFAFSADERSVVVLGRDGVLHSYDAATGKPGARSAVLRHEQWKSPSHIETAGDGRFVVWGAEKVRLVSADLSAVTASFDEGGEVVLVSTNPRGDRLAIARRKGPVELWDVSPKIAVPAIDDEMLESACGHIGRALTAEEWAAYIPDRRYVPYCQ